MIPEGETNCPKCGGGGEMVEKKGRVKRVAVPMVVCEEFLAEEVWDRKTTPKFIIYWFDEDRFEEKDEIYLGEMDEKGRKIVYVPIFNEMLKKGTVIVPTGIKECTFKEVLDKIDRFVSLPNYDACGKEPMVKFLARVCLCSWFLDRFVEDPLMDVAGAGKFAPIIPIRGPSQSGKNRLAFLLRMISYRPYFEMSTYRVPSLYRPLDVWQGSLVLDEADFAQTTERSELIHFLNCRATGTPISRQDPKNPKVTHVFYNFGQTILTQRRIFDDNATESRCLPFYSEATDKQLPTVETDTMLQQGLELQNMLLYLRMKYYKKVAIDKTAWVNGTSDPRLVASLLPLLAIGKFEPKVASIANGVIQEVERLKIVQKAESEDGVVVNYLWERISEGLFALWNNPHFYVLNKEKRGDGEDDWEAVPLTAARIAEDLKWTTRAVRKVINSLNLDSKDLPSRIKVGNKAYRVIFFNPERLEKRLKEFVVDYKLGKIFEIVKEKLGVTGQQKLEVGDGSDASDTSNYIYSQQKEGQEIGENGESLYIGETVTSVTSVTNRFEISIHKCGECKYWRAGKCLLRVEWIIVTPEHPACEKFEPREEAAQPA